MGKYNSDFKLAVVQQVLNHGRTYSEVARENGISTSTVRGWVEVYQAHGMEGLDRKHAQYSGEFKQEVVEDMRDNHLSLVETVAKYNLGNHHVVAVWERIYLEEGAQGLYVERRGRTSSSNSGRPPNLDKKVEEDLIAENQRLRMENDYLKKLRALVQQEKQQTNKKHR